MRELAILTFVTLDGVMQAPAAPDEDTSGGFQCGGWASQYWGDVMAQVGDEAMNEPYDLLLGRKTYESFAPHWSSAEESPMSRTLNDATKYVATNTLSTLDWQHSIPIADDIAAAVGRLKAQDGLPLQVHGSWQLIQLLLAHDLIDEFRLWTFPVMVGKGKRLFSGNTKPNNLRLVKTEPTSNGVVMSIYRREKSD